MATSRSMSSATLRRRAAVSACCSDEPWAKLSRATSMPAATMALSTWESREAGPMVATIFVERMDAWNIEQWRRTKSPLLANGWPGVRLTLAAWEALYEPRP